MSLFGTMQTSVSGMSAQSNALSTIGDNIANSGTVGYKEAGAQFETLLGQSTPGEYASGGVNTNVRYGITSQGTLTTTSSATDLAVNGNGFFVVSKNGQGEFLTRAGSFVPDSNGDLVNTAGYQLMGYSISNGSAGSTLVPVNISASSYAFAASKTGTLTANLPATDAIVAGAPTQPFPSSNSANAVYSEKTSLTVYDDLGTSSVLDVYFTKTATNTWNVDVYQQSQAAAGGGFPYGAAEVGSAAMTFDPTTGGLLTPANGSMAVTVGSNTINFDISGMQQLATGFGVSTAKADGEAPSKLSSVAISGDGTLTAVYGSGLQIAAYKIPLGNVAAPNNLTPVSGNVYQQSNGSGPIVISSASSNGMGSVQSGALEQSTVDLATELTNMIQAQRTYEANSKVLQTASSLLGVLNNLNTN